MVILRLWSRYLIVIVIVSHQINRNCVNLFIGIIREHSWIPICMFALLYNDDDLVLFPVTDVLDSMQFTVIKLKDLVEGENESLEWGLLLRGRIFKGVKIFIIRTSSGRRISDQQLYWSQFQPVNSNWIVFICNQTGCSLRCISNDCSLISNESFEQPFRLQFQMEQSSSAIKLVVSKSFSNLIDLWTSRW